VNEKRLIEYEQLIKHADGTYHSYHTSKFPLYDSDNEVYAVSAISTDISESKKNLEMRERLAAQEIMLKSEIRYDELTENMPNMFFSLNRTLIYTSFNKACEKFTGIAAEQVIGKTVGQAFPEGAPFSSDEYNEVLKSGISKNYVSSFTYQGNPFTYIINIYPTENGISVLMTDLTKQKKAETETLELVDRLQTKNKDLRQFAYALSHDLRAPIARVLGLVSLSGMVPEEMINNKTLMENVADEVTNLDNVVKDMNEVISVRAEGKQKEYVDFETELSLIRKILAREIKESEAVIIADFQSPKGIITVKSYLYSILYNLLSNAIKYRSPDRPLTIHLQTRQDSEFISLTVKDNGMGMDLKMYGEKVFGLYSRFHGDKIDGKGIGLNLVKAQAESLGGKVEVESEVNRGSTFTVYFTLKNI
jgi:PAS domain S-box-containing protein